MIFGFKKDKSSGGGRDDDDDVEYEEVELVRFLGSMNEKEANLAENARLAKAGLLPTKEIITEAIERRADVVRVEPRGPAAAIRFVVDGVQYSGSKIPAQRGAAITQMTKLLAGLDIAVRNKRQRGGIRAQHENVNYELDVDAAPLPEGGERLTVTLRNLKVKRETPEEIGMPPALKAKIRELSARGKGAILVCGPAESGVTTTSFAVMLAIDAYMYTIYKVADTGAREFRNISDFKPEPGEDLESTIRRALRVEAAVIMLDPIADAAAAKTVFKMQDAVSLVAEFKAADAAQGIAQLVKWIGDPQQVADGLAAIISPKLIRLLCKECRMAYRPNPKLVQKVGLPPETTVLYRPQVAGGDDEEFAPCDECGGIGYKGRTGIFEIIEMTEAIQKLVAAGASPADVKSQARKENMPSHQKEALRLVAEGLTSLEEVQRVFKA